MDIEDQSSFCWLTLGSEKQIPLLKNSPSFLGVVQETKSQTPVPVSLHVFLCFQILLDQCRIQLKSNLLGKMEEEEKV